jgi:uncharacterized membrane protein
MRINEMLTVIGVLAALLGTGFMAFELFFAFQGNAYGGVMAGNSTGFAYPTKEFISWGRRKKWCMFIGFILIVIGTALQVWAVIAQGYACSSLG